MKVARSRPVNYPSQIKIQSPIQTFSVPPRNPHLQQLDRNITRVILLKATTCSTLLVCLLLSVMLLLDSANDSAAYLLCALLSACAMASVYLIPTHYCAMLLTQRHWLHRQSR